MLGLRHPLPPVLLCALLWGSAFPVIKHVYGYWAEIGLERSLPMAEAPPGSGEALWIMAHASMVGDEVTLKIGPLLPIVWLPVKTQRRKVGDALRLSTALPE